MTNFISITKPDDWHVHFRDNEMLEFTVNATAKYFKRALVMPNLKTPLTQVKEIIAYKERINAVLKYSFTPYFTFYLNENLEKSQLMLAKEKYPNILGAKLYPHNVTTNAEGGVKTIESIYPLLETMQELDLVLQIHGEENTVDIFEREQVFLTQHLTSIIKNFPRLRIVLEHISTKEAVLFIKNTPSNVAATITAHHLLFTRNDMLSNGIKPHYYCLPILKTSEDKKALLQAATSGSDKFFAGTDSAPHLKKQKECSSGCAGIFTAPIALSLYAQAFDTVGKITNLEKFSSTAGAKFYQLPVSEEKINLIKEEFKVPKFYMTNTNKIIPVSANTNLNWSVNNNA